MTRKGHISSECYFAVKGAALVLPQNECQHVYRKTNINRDDIQQHLQSMFYLLRSEDTLKMAVKLESFHNGRTRYLVVVSYTGRNGEESCLLGIDCNDKVSIGLVLPIWVDSQITLDGDGGFSVSSSTRYHIFKPVSVQAMWSALQTLHKASSKARECNYFMGGLTHTWIEYYEKKIHSDRSCLNEWHAMDDLESRRPRSPDYLLRSSEREATESYIRGKLKEIMMSVDLDEVTSKYIRCKLEEDMNVHLNEYKSFIDQEMLVILGQMDAATEIFDYLYLGSEWNASNLEELQRHGVGHILNVTREIDNFYPGMFDYLNIRVYDEEGTELLRHWDKTYKFIANAKKSGSKVLVHCKMGVSRSASVVIAYAMKAYDWSMSRALEYIKTKRTCIKPNTGFMKQLETYQGILDASKQRHNQLWRSKSETNLKSPQQELGICETDHVIPEPNQQILSMYLESPSPSHRPKSWSPEDNIVNMLFADSTSGNDVIDSTDPLQENGIKLPSKVQTRNKHMLLPGRNGQAYCVSQNKVLHLPTRADGKRRKQVLSSSLDDDDLVKFSIGDGDDSPVFECRNPIYSDTGTDDEIVTQVPSLKRVSSIKDRINELELQAHHGDQKGAKDQLDLPEVRGLVLNLANQFESGSKPNTPSPVDDGETLSDCCNQILPAVVEGNGPVLAQMKPPTPRHQAVLVKTENWQDEAKPGELTMKLRINGTPHPVSVKDETPGSKKREDPFSAQVDRVFDREERTGFGDVSPSRQNSWGSSDSAIGIQTQRESPSRQSSWGSADSQGTLLSRHSSWGSADCRHGPGKAIARRPSTFDSQYGSPGNEPGLFTENVLYGWRKESDEGLLKRTNSFDGSFTPVETTPVELPSPIQRSQSLRVSEVALRTKFPNLRVHAPTPYRSPEERRRLSLQSPILHCASFPSLFANRNGNALYSSHAVSQPEMSRYDMKSDLECLCQETAMDDASGIVNQHKLALESRLTIGKPKLRTSKGATRTTSPEVDVASVGKVKRITKEIESKVSTSPPKRDKMVIVDKEQAMSTSPINTSPVGSPGSPGSSSFPDNAIALDDKSVRSLVGKFETKDFHRTRYHSENDTAPTSSDQSDLTSNLDSSKRKSVGFATPPPSWKDSLTPDATSNGEQLCFSFTVPKPVHLPPKLPLPQNNSGSSGISVIPRRIRKSHGKSHPLNKLMAKQRHPNALYNTM
uniref:protein-serine/threonine phosphatase n=1 Tax=Strigamia maritima TaxID=126957 RepID=T1IXF3_STRMM